MIVLSEKDLHLINGGMMGNENVVVDGEAAAGRVPPFLIVMGIALGGVAIGIPVYNALIGFMCNDRINDDREPCKRHRRGRK